MIDSPLADKNRGRRARVGRLFAFFTAMLVLCVAFRVSGIAFNLTDSMPVGFYHVAPLAGGVRAGDIVRVCVPESVAAFGRGRGYIPATAGDCPHDVAPMLKIVVATGGDRVDLRDDAVLVDGHALPGSRTYRKDGKGRPLPHVRRGEYRLAADQVWLWTPNPRSWDSRYYGPVAASDVLGGATLLLALGDWPFANVR